MADSFDRLKTALADRYAIREEIGAGGMATVYLAEDLKHHRKVAVKVLRPELAAILGAERFLKEIEVTANLQHPNILPLYDSGEADSFLYYVMPYIEGETLRDKLNREKQLAVEETVEIAKSVAGALSFAHERGVIHRDIKPENILLQSGQALVADFGIALAVSQAGGTRLTETGLSLGTPHYMSPEQATGDRELDARSDVYSLGATVYEMLVGDPPHIGSSAQAIIAKILSEKPSPITQSRDLVPANVDAAVQKALAKSPADRFTTAAKFAEALTNPAFTLPTTQAAAASPADGRWKRLAASFAGLAAVFAVLAVWAWWWPTPKPVARFSLALPQGEELRPGFGSTFALSPDGSRFVYSGPDEEGTQLWLRERDQLHATPLPGTAEAASPFFSPDGQAVAFFAGSPRRLDVVSLGGGPPVTLADSGVLLQGGGDWGPDDYLYFDRRDGLWRVAANGGEPERVTVVDRARGEARHAWPDVLPNGKGALFTIFSSSYTNLSEYDIAVVEFATGEVQVLMRGVYARYAASGYLVVVRADGALLAAPFDHEKLALTGPATPLGERVRVVGLGAVELAFSETGTLLYGTGGSVTERVVWVERDGTVREIDPGWTADFESLALSPDGTRLAVSIQPPGEPNDVWVKQLDRGPLSRLTFGGSTNSRPTWVPDGQAVTFVSNRGRGDNQDLYLRRADGSGPAEVLLDRERGVAEGFWSPDGQWLIYRTSLNERGRGDVLAIRPAVDTMPVALVATEFAEHSPALSPDGRWLVYVSNRSGRDEVYVRPFPNAEDAMWPVSTGGGIEPVWAHSGRELFYRNGANELVAAEVVATPGFTVGTQRVLFSLVDYQTDDPHTPYAVNSDDQRFMMIRRAGAVQGELILVLNFFEELKAKVGN